MTLAISACMTDMLSLFSKPELVNALNAFSGVTDQHRCNELHQEVERIISADLKFEVDEGHGYPGGCNNYMVYHDAGPDQPSSNSCDYDFDKGKLTLNVHDGAGYSVEKYVTVIDGWREPMPILEAMQIVYDLADGNALTKRGVEEDPDVLRPVYDQQQEALRLVNTYITSELGG